MTLTRYTITKTLHGDLEGITVTDTVTSSEPPFTPGQYVNGMGCPYTVVSCIPDTLTEMTASHPCDPHGCGGEHCADGSCAVCSARCGCWNARNLGRCIHRVDGVS